LQNKKVTLEKSLQHDKNATPANGGKSLAGVRENGIEKEKLPSAAQWDEIYSYCY